MSSQQNFDLILTMEGNKIYMETSNNFKMTSIKLKFKHPLIYKQSLQFGKTLDAKSTYIKNIDLIDNNKKSWLELYGNEMMKEICWEYFYAYNNYMLVLTDYHDGLEGFYSESDLALLKKLETLIS